MAGVIAGIKTMNSKQAIAEAKKLTPSYVAQDEDGEWWVYYNKPHIHTEHNHWHDPVNYNSCMQLSEGNKKNPDWQNSLRKVK